MTISSRIVFCGNCGTILDENGSTPLENQRPCPECGSQKRSASITANAEMSTKNIRRAREGRRKKGKPILEQLVGDQIQETTGKWMKKRE
jgi:hypothetical protein